MIRPNQLLAMEFDCPEAAPACAGQRAHTTPEPDMPPPKPEKDPPPDNMPMPDQAPIEEPHPPQPPIKT
jgi:hypothetical protein